MIFQSLQTNKKQEMYFNDNSDNKLQKFINESPNTLSRRQKTKNEFNKVLSVPLTTVTYSKCSSNSDYFSRF